MASRVVEEAFSVHFETQRLKAKVSYHFKA